MIHVVTMNSLWVPWHLSELTLRIDSSGYLCVDYLGALKAIHPSQARGMDLDWNTHHSLKEVKVGNKQGVIKDWKYKDVEDYIVVKSSQ